ncbi:MAG TPA: hypothetical protein VFO62_10400 [Candidatus Binatia bacterium]|nr:hypothetical protein [Candidatus Binatia bacterium]
MPIGYSCEFPTFEACVRAQRSQGHTEEEARRICGRIQAETKAKCSQRPHVLKRQR